MSKSTVPRLCRSRPDAGMTKHIFYPAARAASVGTSLLVKY